LGGKATKISRNTSIAIDKTTEYLKEKRCLLILDDADAILENRSTNKNNPLIADYIEFFDRLNSVEHNSCCLIILEQKVVDYKFNYQQLTIKELDWQSCQMIFAKDELKGSPIDWERLVHKYSGNPQYLKSIVPTIKSVFDGNIARFLDANILLYDRTEKLIAEQLERLSPEEMTLIMCMAAEGKALTLEQLLAHFKGKISDRQLLKTVDRSLNKCLVVVKHGRFVLSDLVAEYMIDRYEDLKMNYYNDGSVSIRITSNS
jgi:hypothetical protein